MAQQSNNYVCCATDKLLIRGTTKISVFVGIDDKACIDMFVKVFKNVHNVSEAEVLVFQQALQEMFFNRNMTEMSRPKP